MDGNKANKVFKVEISFTDGTGERVYIKDWTAAPTALEAIKTVEKSRAHNLPANPVEIFADYNANAFIC